MRVPQSYIQKCKIVAHVFQLLFIFIGGCMTIAVLTKDGSTGGATKYFFALCFLSIPALIYLVMVPMWSRAQRFANAYAFVSLDGLYTILWFAAFIAVAMWNANGIKEEAKNRKIGENDGNCTTFKFGPEDKCKISKATVGIGAVIFFFFALTTGISAYYLVKFRKEGVLPYESDQINAHHASGETQKDNAWSTEMGHRDSDEEDRHTERGGNQEEDEYALLHSTETEEGRHPGRPLSWGDDGYGRDPVPPYSGYNDNHNALSPGGYEEYRRDAGAHTATHGPSGYEEYRRDPAPHYDSAAPRPGGQGYSFSGGDRY